MKIVLATAHALWLTLHTNVIYLLNLVTGVMSKTQRPNYISSEIKKVNQVDLKKALKDVNDKNREIRESFKMDRDTLAFRTGR